MAESKSDKPTLGPSSSVLETLREAEFTPATNLQKPSGQKISTRLIREGVGMIGLESEQENREWSGIFNHVVKTAGASLKFGRLLKLNGQMIDLQLMLDVVMLSHSGRRQYDEAMEFPTEVADAGIRTQKGDSAIGLDNLKRRDLSEALVDAVSKSGQSTIATTWEEKIPAYLDHRIAQDAITLGERFAGLQGEVGTGRFTQEFLNTLYESDKKTEQELFDALFIPSFETITLNPANLRVRIDMAIKLGKFSKKEAKVLRTTKVYKPKSGKNIDVSAVIGLRHEEFLERLQLIPDDINDKFLEPELWERYVRRLYINDAEQGIFSRLSKLHKEISEGKIGSREELEEEFPENTWWGKYARELYGKRKGIPLHPRLHKQLGVARAIEFYRQLDARDDE